MTEHQITVDVYAHWGDICPKYRLFVDGDLLTERDFTWPGHDTFIREHIIVTLEPGEHELKIEQINTHGSVHTRNILIDGVESATKFVTVE